jgi:hypothetical protein
MGRPPSCGCHCNIDVEPPIPDEPANFMVVLFMDEAQPDYCSGRNDTPDDANALSLFNSHIAYLRHKEQTIGRVNMVMLQPERSGPWATDGTALMLKPKAYSGVGPEGLPEEVVYFNQVTRQDPFNHAGKQAGPVTSDRDIMTHVTNNIIRGNYNCIGVLIDNSVSVLRTHVADLVDEWYWNISTSEASHAEYTRYIVDGNGDPWPLPACAGGTLGLGKANGCVYESLLPQPEHWLVHAADNSQAIFQHPNGCSNSCFCTGWLELCNVISDPTEVPTTVTFNYSFIQAGTKAIEDDGAGSIVEKTCVTLQNKLANGDITVTNAEFKTEIAEAIAVWKAAFENICSWLTVNFVNLGDETTTDIPSSALGPPGGYSLPQGNIGDIRIGMHRIDGAGSTIGHAWYPGGVLGSVGNVGGDLHFEGDGTSDADQWRLDSTHEDEATGALSIKVLMVHELGHVFGIGHLSDPTAIMYPSVSATTYYDDVQTGADRDPWPGGIVGSPADLAALKAVYCVS